jgi:hypothetical protein
MDSLTEKLFNFKNFFFVILSFSFKFFFVEKKLIFKQKKSLVMPFLQNDSLGLNLQKLYSCNLQ